MKRQSKLGASIRHSFTSRNFHVGSYSILAAAFVIAIAVAVNLLVSALPASVTQLDCTANGLYSISQETELMAEDLTEDVEIYLLVESGQEDSTISTVLDRYKSLSDHITVSKVDPVANPTFAQQYTDSTVSNNSLLVVSGDKSQYIDYNDIYEANYDDYYTTGSISYNFDGEGLITSAISYVTSSDLPTVYTLTGHGEQSLSSNFSTAVSRQNIKVEELSLLTLETVPEDCRCLIIIGPTSDISADELKKIQTYLKSGGNLLLYTDVTDAELPNLTALMDSYGVAAETGMLLEGDANYSVFGYNYYLLPEIESHTITSPLTSSGYYILVPMAQGLYETGSQPDSVTISPLLTTSSSAYIKADGLNMTITEQEDGDQVGQYHLGLAITDEISDETESRIVWYSSSMLLDDSVNEMVSGANQDLFLNSLKWMCGETESITIHAKSLSSEKLTVSAASASRWSMILVFLIPAAFLAISLSVTIRRKRR